MADKIENQTLAASLNEKLEKSKGIVFAAGGIVVVLIVALAVIASVRAKEISKGIERVDSISYSLLSESAEISDSDIAARQNKALEELAPLSGKSGVVGLRSNMLVAEIKFAQKNYDEARSAWLKAADVNKKAYTAPLCYYNAAVCCENLNDIDGAVSYYKVASEYEDFVLIDHALFSLGRVNEAAQKYDEAKAAYEKLNEIRPSSNWGKLAKSRIIFLKSAGNI